MRDLRLGTARIDITPRWPLPLAGFAVRHGVSAGVAQPLAARVLYFSQDEPAGGARAALVVSADLIWWGSDRVPALRRRIRERWGLEESAMLLHGTHSHSGPQTSANFTPSLGLPDERYLTWLEAQLLDAIGRAIADSEPVTVERGRGDCPIGINRRRWRAGALEQAPNASGLVDPEVIVVRFRARKGRTKALLVHFACHPVISVDPLVSGEFPGAAMTALEAALGGGAVAAYLQGCCGDINPALIRDGALVRGHEAEIRAFGGALATAVTAVLEGPLDPLPPGPLRSRRLTVDLPLQAPPDAADLAAVRDAPGVTGEWSRLLLRHPERLRPVAPLELTLLDLAGGLSLLALNAEVTVAYGLFAKAQFAGRALPVAYSNGMIGYVVTAEQLREGGYEADESTRYFGLPARFAPELEERVKRGMLHLVTGPEAPLAAALPGR